MQTFSGETSLVLDRAVRTAIEGQTGAGLSLVEAEAAVFEEIGKIIKSAM